MDRGQDDKDQGFESFKRFHLELSMYFQRLTIRNCLKEMTVKGLEPELRNMMEQHAEEIQKLRNLHMKELQDTELRIIRRSNQQLEQLRLELTASHERMLANEKNILWTRCRINFLEKSD